MSCKWCENKEQHSHCGKTTGLTIQEAIKSGKRFRRKVISDIDWYIMSHSNYGLSLLSSNKADNNYPLDREDILASDWEVEPEPEQKIELTKTKFLEAWQKSFTPPNVIISSEPSDRWYRHDINVILKELGFTE